MLARFFKESEILLKRLANLDSSRAQFTRNLIPHYSTQKRRDVSRELANSNLSIPLPTSVVGPQMSQLSPDFSKRLPRCMMGSEEKA